MSAKRKKKGPGQQQHPSGMRLGVAYNVFDGHELLERSIETVRSNAEYVVVVYQVVSNFGEPASPHLEPFLRRLRDRGLVDDLVCYTPSEFRDERERKKLAATEGTELEGPLSTIAPQFFNEVKKRELGRVRARDRGCTHFLSMDSDEFYHSDEFSRAMHLIMDNDYDTTACRMRLFLKEPIYEFFPYDNLNAVPFICKLRRKSQLRLASPFPVLADPTRRIHPLGNFFFFDRAFLEMYHYTLVRLDMRSKLNNVSNKANLVAVRRFLADYERYRGPEDGVIHPHPVSKSQFCDVRIVDNWFDIDFSRICLACYNAGKIKCSNCDWKIACKQGHLSEAKQKHRCSARK